MTDRKARIEEIAAMGLDGQVAQLEAELEEAVSRRAVIERRAAAAALLHGMAARREASRSLELTAPVAQRLDRWLRVLSGERYVGVALDEMLVPRHVAVEGHESRLPLSSLSFGTHEQVTVLLRLALGVLLSEEERQLVVLDDRLVNADSTRMKRLCRILEEASASCQVIVATCHEANYDSIDACVVRLDLRQLPRPARQAPLGEARD